MSGKLYIASILAFTLIGCGGTNAGACCSGGIAKGEEATGIKMVVADETGKTNTTIEAKVDNKGKEDNTPTSTVQVIDVRGEGVVCPTTNPCSFSVVQNASNCDEKTPSLQISDCEKSSAEAYLKGKFTPAEEIVVFGGILTVSETSGQVTTCGLNVKFNIPSHWCGKELGTGESAGFTGDYKNDDSLYVLITIADANGCPVTVWEKAKIRNGQIILDNLTGVVLPAQFSLFRITAMPNRLSGMTGIFN